MSAWKFKNVKKSQNLVVLYFDDTSHPEFGEDDIHSVTIHAADAKKLLSKLNAALHPSVSQSVRH